VGGGPTLPMGSCFSCSRLGSWGPAPPGRGQRRIIGKRDSGGQLRFPFFFPARGGGGGARGRAGWRSLRSRVGERRDTAGRGCPTSAHLPSSRPGNRAPPHGYSRIALHYISSI